MMASPAENECASFVMCGSRGRLLLLLLVVSSNASVDAVINEGDSRKLERVVLVTVVVLILVLSSRR